MNTSHITDTLPRTVTDTIPHAIADTVSHTLADVGSILESVPDAVADGVASGMTSGRRFARSAADHVPGIPNRSSTERRWWIVAALAAAAVVGLVWYSRRTSNQRTDVGQADIADIDARRSVA